MITIQNSATFEKTRHALRSIITIELPNGASFQISVVDENTIEVMKTGSLNHEMTIRPMSGNVVHVRAELDAELQAEKRAAYHARFGED